MGRGSGEQREWAWESWVQDGSERIKNARLATRVCEKVGSGSVGSVRTIGRAGRSITVPINGKPGHARTQPAASGPDRMPSA